MNYSIDKTVGKHLEARNRVTLIKDTLTTGNTLKNTVQALENIPGNPVCHVIVSVDRMEKDSMLLSARHEIEKMNRVKIHSIVTLDDIIHAMEHGIVGGTEYLDAIRRYRERYGGE